MHHHLRITSLIITLAALGACSRDVLHTGAAGTTVAPSIPVPIHPVAGGVCDAGVDTCSSQGTPGTQGPDQGGCDPGRVACPGQGTGYCFDLQASPDHCGTCGHACALGSPCERGQCRVVHCTSQMSSRSLPVEGFNLRDDRSIPTDCDRDGNLDLLTFGPNKDPSKFEMNVGVLRGQGDGTYVLGELYSAGPQTNKYSMVVADLNRDQISDLIAMVSFSDSTSSTGRVIVRLGRGDCTFGPEIGLDLGADGDTLAIGDLDADGIPDLAVSTGERVSTFHGNGDGSFSNRQDFAVGTTLSFVPQMLVTDWNSDGVPDLVVSDDYLHLLLGTGGGRFAPAIDCTLTVSPLVIADFDGDGVVDLASYDTVLFGMHECDFTKQIVFRASGSTHALVSGSTIPLAAGDFNGDGTVDLVFASSDGVGFVAGDGQGNFGAVVMFGDLGADHTPGASYTPWLPFSAYAGDFNGDGRLDLVMTSNTVPRTLINTCQ